MLDEVFPFFADAKNLERLTPPWLGFTVLKMSTERIGAGTLIDYRLKVHGVPIHWRSAIEEWDFGKRFVDRQLRGPYSHWHHTHTFLEANGGTWILDEIEYALPGGAVGNATGHPFVRRDLEKIFAYRRNAVSEIFKRPV